MKSLRRERERESEERETWEEGNIEKGRERVLGENE